MKSRIFLATMLLGAFSIFALSALAQQGDSKSDESRKLKDDLAFEEAVLSRQYAEFEQSLLKLAQRLKRSSKLEDRQRAEVLENVLKASREGAILVNFEQLVQQLKSDRGLGNLNETQIALNRADKLAEKLREIIELYRADPRATRLKDEAKSLKEMIERIDRIRREQERIQAETIRGKENPDTIKKDQETNAAETGKLARDMAKFGVGGEAKKQGESKDGGKAANKGESKDAGKSDGGKKGETKEAGKDGQGKQGEAKGGEAKSAKEGQGEAKAGQKGSEAKDGQAKSGKGGDAQAKDNKGGEKGKEAEAKAGGDKAGEAKAGAKGGDPKAGDPKAGDPKAGAKSGDPKGGEAKAAKDGAKSGENKDGGKGGEAKQGEAKAGEGKSGQGQAKSGGQKSGDQGAQKQGPQNPNQPAPKEDLTKSREKVQDAEGYETKAADKIKQRPDQAADDQEMAIQRLKEAKKKLEDLLQQIREEELERLLAQLEARCQKMLRMQIAVRNGTVGVFKTIELTADKQPTREDKQASLGLADKEQEIVVEATKAIEMLEAEGSAVAFPEVFQQVREDMKHVQRRLGITDVGIVTQAIEQDIISSLEEMIAALKKAKQDLDNKKNPPPGDSKSNPNADQKLLDQIAELKMIRSLQLRVNQRTETYAKMYAGEQAADPVIRRELQQLSDRQNRIYEVTNRIAKGDNK